jgi:hypothetical protein
MIFCRSADLDIIFQGTVAYRCRLARRRCRSYSAPPCLRVNQKFARGDAEARRRATLPVAASVGSGIWLRLCRAVFIPSYLCSSVVPFLLCEASVTLSFAVQGADSIPKARVRGVGASTGWCRASRGPSRGPRRAACRCTRGAAASGPWSWGRSGRRGPGT